MILDVGGDVEVARRRSHGSGIAFAGHAQPGTALSTGRYANFHHFGMGQPAVAVAGGANVLEPSLAVASRAGEVELHIARHLSYIPGTTALGTGNRPGFIASGAVAGGALVVAGDFDFGLSAADGLPETDVQSVFEVGAFLRFRFGLLAGAAVEELAEDVFE